MARSLGRIAAAAALIAGLVALGLSNASAGPPTTATDFRLQRGMNLVGFDATVAKAHGFKIVTYADGSQQAVPANPHDKTRKPSPIVPKADQRRPGAMSASVAQDTVWGNCGYSYIEGAQDAAHQIWLNSGFHVNNWATSYSWLISLYDRNGHSYVGASGGLNFRNDWHRFWDGRQQYGYSIDEVESSYSYAFIWYGGICVSGGPWIVISPIWG